ncbi:MULTISPECIES: lycopene cyclase family protein [unclassified Rhodococcus (in: high G+C Gram-positive bacteria)]|uniref:lycopene cyclase family protein n=1 Tax=unclassified Rhodococcus (in: high G+C Gram-positive bacteria) TaxID=192944 RepID=UPI00138ECF6D|nr:MULTISPECIES: lycopene cyclase family protein [unclassified Rhodococcus (in: high G+C Gram-positive bacteria)]
MDHRRDGARRRRTVGDGVPLTDVLVLGAGPSGRAAAHRCARAGASVTLMDPHPDRRWINTYGTWADEVPGWVPASVRASTVDSPVVIGERRHVVGRSYTVLDTSRLQDCLTLDGVTVVAAHAAAVDSRSVTTADGTVVTAGTVVDARGSAVGPGIPEQTAYGIVVDADVAARTMDDAPTLVMDWRQDNGSVVGATPSFLYAVPLGDGSVLLEETCLVGRPGLPFSELSRRLTVRLEGRGLSPTGDEPVERVRFAMRPPATTVAGVLTTGTRSPALHTATGYSVAASLRRADAITGAVLTGGRVDTVRSRTVNRLRSIGADALLDLAPGAIATFFDTFFDMSDASQRAYLSSDDDVTGMSRAMLTVFSRIDHADRRVILGAVRRTVMSAVPGAASESG